MITCWSHGRCPPSKCFPVWKARVTSIMSANDQWVSDSLTRWLTSLLEHDAKNKQEIIIWMITCWSHGRCPPSKCLIVLLVSFRTLALCSPHSCHKRFFFVIYNLNLETLILIANFVSNGIPQKNACRIFIFWRKWMNFFCGGGVDSRAT